MAIPFPSDQYEEVLQPAVGLKDAGEAGQDSMVLEVEKGKESMGVLGSKSAYGGSGRSSMVSTKNRWRH